MHRLSVLFGASLLIAAPLAPRDIPAFFSRLALQSELEDFAGTVQGLSVRHIHFAVSRRAVVIEGLVLRRPGLAMRIGRLTLRLPQSRAFLADGGLMQAAAAAGVQVPSANAAPSLGESVTADDVSIDTGTVHASIKHMRLDGTKLGKADIAALLDPHSAVPAAERLAKISAAHVAIPELVIESKTVGAPDAVLPNKIGPPPTAPQDEKIVLHDITMDSVVQGHAGVVAIVSADMLLHSPETEEMQGTFGPIRATNLDLVQLARLLAPAAGNAPQPQHQICDSLDIGGGKISAPDAEADLSVATVKIKNIAISPSKPAPSVGVSGPDATNDKSKNNKSKSAFAQMLQNLDIGSLQFIALHFATKSGSPWSAGIGHGSMAGIKSGRAADAGFENTKIITRDAAVSIGQLAWHGLTLQGPMKFLGMGAPGTKSSQNALPGQQKIVADAIAVVLTKVDPSTARSPTQFQIRHAELASSAPIDGVPTRLTADVEHFTCDLTNVNAHDPSVAALGYNKLDLTSRLAMHLNNNNSEFGLDGLSLSGSDMGSVQISGFMDHLTKAIMSSDPIESKGALLNVRLRHLEFRVQNAGLFERFLAAEAKRANTSPAIVREKLLASITGNLPDLLANSPDSDLITAALGTFMADPKSLRLSILVPQGISAADVISADDPRLLEKRIEVEVSANQ